MRRRQFGNSGELVARPQLTGRDLLPQLGSNVLVRTTRYGALRRRDRARRHPSGQRPSGPLVGLRQPGGVHPERRGPATAVTEATGDRRHVDARVN